MKKSETIHLVQLVRFLDEALAKPDSALREYITALRDKCQRNWTNEIISAIDIAEARRLREKEGVPIPGVKIVGETRLHREKP